MKKWIQYRREGFTIIEVLIVIVVIGILAAIIVVGFVTVQNGAHDASIKADLTKLSDAIHVKSLDDQQIPSGGATSSLGGDSTVFYTVGVDIDEDSYDPTVANLFYCAGDIDGTDVFGLIARSVSGKVFKYLSNAGVSEYTGNLVWSTTPELDACAALGFTAPYTWSYGYNPSSELLWFDWTQGGKDPDLIDPIALWKFNGNANDSIGSANGTVSGATLTANKDGEPNEAYHFDGVDDYIELPPVISDSNSFSVVLWARAVAGASAAESIGYIAHQSTTMYQGNSVFWIAVGTGLYGSFVSSAGSANNKYSDVGANTSVWHMIAVTYDGTTRNMYVDGQLKSSAPAPFTNTLSGTRVGIGSTPFNPTYRPAQGDVDDVRIYDVVLSDTQVNKLYNLGPE